MMPEDIPEKERPTREPQNDGPVESVACRKCETPTPCATARDNEGFCSQCSAEIKDEILSMLATLEKRLLGGFGSSAVLYERRFPANSHERRFADQILAGLREPRSVAGLRKRLGIEFHAAGSGKTSEEIVAHTRKRVNHWTEMLQKSWGDKTKAFRRLAAMGEDAAPALGVVGRYLVGTNEEYRLKAVEVFMAVGPAGVAEAPGLIGRLEASLEKKFDAAAAVVLAIGAIGPEAREAVPLLRKALEVKDRWFRKGHGLRFCAALALHRLGEISRGEAERYNVQYQKLARSGLHVFPPRPFMAKVRRTLGIGEVPGYIAGPAGRWADVLKASPKKFWVNRKEAFRRLAAMGADAAPALRVVGRYLVGTNEEYRLKAVEVFMAVGPAGAAETPALMGRLKTRSKEDLNAAAAVALAIAAIGPEARDAIPLLRKASEVKDRWFQTGHGLRCCAALALFRLGAMSLSEAEWYVAQHQTQALHRPGIFPPAAYVEQLPYRLALRCERERKQAAQSAAVTGLQLETRQERRSGSQLAERAKLEVDYGLVISGNAVEGVLTRGAALPRSFTAACTTNGDNQTSIELTVLVRDQPTAAYEPLGRFAIVGLPPLPKGTPKLSVTLRVEAADRLRIEARDMAADQPLEVVRL